MAPCPGAACATSSRLSPLDTPPCGTWRTGSRLEFRSSRLIQGHGKVAPAGACYHQKMSPLVADLRYLLPWQFYPIILGAYIALHVTPLYSICAVCGRAWDISPLTDQQLGGLLTWIPTAMMSVVGVLVVLHHMLHDPEAMTTRAQPAAGTATGAPA